MLLTSCSGPALSPSLDTTRVSPAGPSGLASISKKCPLVQHTRQVCLELEAGATSRPFPQVEPNDTALLCFMTYRLDTPWVGSDHRYGRRLRCGWLDNLHSTPYPRHSCQGPSMYANVFAIGGELLIPSSPPPVPPTFGGSTRRLTQSHEQVS